MIQKMLTDYYKFIEYDIKSKPIVLENIEKVINCGPSMAGPCMTVHIVETFHCHSNFHLTCGAKYSNGRSFHRSKH